MRNVDRLLRLAVPGLAATLAGAGVLIVLLDHPASSASRMAEAAEPVPIASRPCEKQAWPHIDRRCLSADATHTTPRKVRVVTTDRLAEPPVVEQIAPQPATALAAVDAVVASAPPPATVQPTAPPAAHIPVMAMTEVQKPKPARRTAKRERRRAPIQRSYEVPAMAYDAIQPTRRVTVTSPGRYEELFGPRF